MTHTCELFQKGSFLYIKSDKHCQSIPFIFIYIYKIVIPSSRNKTQFRSFEITMITISTSVIGTVFSCYQWSLQPRQLWAESQMPLHPRGLSPNERLQFCHHVTQTNVIKKNLKFEDCPLYTALFKVRIQYMRIRILIS